MKLRAHPFRAVPLTVAFVLNVVVGPLAPITQLASAPVMALSGSTFDATDGNFAVNGSETDWCSPGLTVVTKNDLATGQTDDSYAEGAKEDDANPPVETGSIPNNKVDLTRIHVAGETGAGGDLFVYVGWLRSDDNGTGTISFEMNQSGVIQSNGVNPVRTVGDLLITFNFHGGGFESLTVRSWTGSTWGAETDLVAGGLGEGSVNAGAVTDCSGGSVPALHFGEFSFNLTDLIGGDCRAFANLFAKSRASNSIESKLKELIKPAGIDLSTCGQLTIEKEDENGDPLGGATFSITPNPFTGSGSLSVTDNAAPDDDAAAGMIHLSDVEPDEYEVCETNAPAGYIIDTTCETLTVAVNGAASFGPFVNGLGDVSWTKVDDETGAKLCCATFSFDGIAGPGNSFGPITVVDNGQNDEDPDAGELLVTDLLLGTYRITETAAPAGYLLPTPAFKDVVLSGQTASPQFAFRDPPHPVLEVVKTPDDGEATAGDPATFTILTTNKGPGTALGAALSDPLPAVANGWSVNSENWLGDCQIAGAAGAVQTLTCGPENLAKDASRSVTVTTEVTDSDCHLLENLATASASNADEASDEGDIDVLCAEIRVEKTPDENANDPGANDLIAGDAAVFTVAVHNDGDGEARGVTLFDDLPGSGWSIDAGNTTLSDCAVSDPTTGPWAALGEILTCGPDEIAAGASAKVAVTKTTSASDCGSIDNTALASTSNDGEDSDSGNIDVLCPDVSVTKTADNSPINAGDDAEYTITVMAGGTGTSANVTLHDSLPSVDGSWSEDHADCTISGLDLDCSFGPMNPGDSETIHLSYKTTAEDCGTLLNDVSVSADGDVNRQNNSVDDVAIVVECPDVKVEKTGSGTVNATDAIFFEITVSNIGEGDAHGFTFSDTLPNVANGWILVLPAEAGCQLNGLALSCAKDVFESGDSFTLRLEADSEVADCGDLPNTASASASNEAQGDLGNNSDGHTIVVECPDLSASKQADDDVVSAGQQIGFTITISNSDADGTGTAYNVQMDDPLPAGSSLDWSENPDGADCEITGSAGAQVLECAFGDMAPGDSASVHVVSATTKLDCSTFLNVASVTSDNHEELNPSDDATVECPGLNISKLADNGTIDAGETASYTIVVWNAGPGTALEASWSDELPHGVSWSVQLMNPDGDDACASSIDSDGNQSASCQFGDLGVTSMANGKVIKVSGETDREDCGDLDNTAFAFASNADTVQASASIHVDCPTVAIEKVNDKPEPVLPGTVVSYTLTVTVGDSQASHVVVTDLLPEGLDAPMSISDGGLYDAATRTLSWALGDLDPGSYPLTYQAAVSLDAEQGDELVNLAVVTSPNSQCPDAQNLADECDDESMVTVRVPTLVIDKSADTQEVHFVFDADGNVLSVDPEQVTWTLTYTLTNGPVTDAVITDPLPEFLVFVSASDGGVHDPATGIITWELGDLLVDGSDSVSFVTTVDPAAPEGDPIVNVATIVSNETPEDDGDDSIIVTSESELGGNPTPKPSVPNTAVVFGPAGEPISIPVELLAFVFIGSLGALAFANVRATRRRR